MPREALDGKGDGSASWQPQCAGFKINDDLRPRFVEQPLVGALIDHDRQQTVLERVGAEDVCDLTADHRPKAIVQQRPGRVLARGTATEVSTAYQHRAAGRPRAIERKFCLGSAVRAVAPVGEELLS